MAIVFGLPEGLTPPVVEYDPYNGELEAEKERMFLTNLRVWIAERRPRGGGPLVGCEIMTPRADGYARYMVASEKPLELIHLPLGDAWRGDPVWERGLRLHDVRRLVAEDKALSELFGEPAQ